MAGRKSTKLVDVEGLVSSYRRGSLRYKGPARESGRFTIGLCQPGRFRYGWVLWKVYSLKFKQIQERDSVGLTIARKPCLLCFDQARWVMPRLKGNQSHEDSRLVCVPFVPKRKVLIHTKSNSICFALELDLVWGHLFDVFL
jgi:hypothetical protein